MCTKGQGAPKWLNEQEKDCIDPPENRGCLTTRVPKAKLRHSFSLRNWLQLTRAGGFQDLVHLHQEDPVTGPSLCLAPLQPLPGPSQPHNLPRKRRKKECRAKKAVGSQPAAPARAPTKRKGSAEPQITFCHRRSSGQSLLLVAGTHCAVGDASAGKLLATGAVRAAASTSSNALASHSQTSTFPIFFYILSLAAQGSHLREVPAPRAPGWGTSEGASLSWWRWRHPQRAQDQQKGSPPLRQLSWSHHRAAFLQGGRRQRLKRRTNGHNEIFSRTQG